MPHYTLDTELHQGARKSKDQRGPLLDMSLPAVYLLTHLSGWDLLGSFDRKVNEDLQYFREIGVSRPGPSKWVTHHSQTTGTSLLIAS